MKLKQNLDAILYDKIIESLILHEYSMGEQISLDSLVHKYGVSRTPVVQAVRLLTNEGVLEGLSNGRVRVPIFTIEEKKQILGVRLLLESYAVDLIRDNVDTMQYETFYQSLQSVIDESHARAAVNDILTFNKMDLKFHRNLVSGSNNKFLSELYKNIQGRFVVANYLSSNWTIDDFKAADRSHYKILADFKQKDFDLCKKDLQEHMMKVCIPSSSKVMCKR